jgi:2-succinyl-6-hydroxy-2,4-cyclohexadiene-1-carboxylate synthase
MSENIAWKSVNGSLASLQAGSGPRIVFVHGFTQTARSWMPVAESFAVDHDVVLVDAPGHGRSGDVRADLNQGGDLIAGVGGQATYVGYSMGARFVLHVALNHPDLVESLVMIGGAAGLLDADERAARRAADDALAADIETEGVERFLERWLALPLFASLPHEANGLEDRFTNTASGLASSLRLAGLGTQAPLWDRLSEISAPTLIMAGELDMKFTDVGHRMAAAIGSNAAFCSVPAAGHAAHLEQPSAVTDAIREWTTETSAERQRRRINPTVAKKP